MSTNTADTAAEPIPYIRAVNEALRWALATYPEALIFGEDLALPGGPFGSTRDLHDEFGDRIFDTPISEAGFVGAATGAAIRGRRPIVEIMFMDFTQVAMDQIVNQLANVHYVSNGAMRAPVTIRTQQGHTPGSVAQHSQSLEAIFAHVPGLRVACPATPRDAYEILRTAIASDDPVIVIEARALYAEKAAVPLDGPLEAMGGAVVRRSGADVTIVTWSRMVPETLAAADLLAERGIDAAVIDLRWLNPLDHDTMAASLSQTGRLVVVHEANVTGGFGAEIAAWAAGERFWDLDHPILRIGTPDVRIPSAPNLQRALVPDAATIADRVEAHLRADADGADASADGLQTN